MEVDSMQRLAETVKHVASRVADRRMFDDPEQQNWWKSPAACVAAVEVTAVPRLDGH
jgi:hypothetical protein